MRATMPEINDEGIVNLAKARHPLLNKDNVVPIDIRLGEGYRTLLITGPNTGGKTVSMKTLGLLVLMTQSGLFIPVQSGSKISIFQMSMLILVMSKALNRASVHFPLICAIS